MAIAGRILDLLRFADLALVVLDEDDLASDSDQHVPTQQSVKAYVDALGGGLSAPKEYDAATNTPDLDVSPVGVSSGDFYIVTVAGTFFTQAVTVDDQLIAKMDDPAVLADWIVIETGVGQATETELGIAELATQAETDAGTDDLRITTPLKLESSQRFGQFKQALSTGFEGTPPALTINGGDNTKFDMSSGVILHTDSSTSPPTVITAVVSAQVAVTPTFIGSDTASFISIDSTGSIIQRTNRSTPEQRRTTATVGLVSHVDKLVIDSVVNTPTTNLEAVSQVHDLIRALGFFSTGGNQISGITSTLTISKSAGTGFALNENVVTNPKDPHNITMIAKNPASMIHILRDVTIVSIGTTIDPTVYDLAGVETTVPANNNATISYVYIFPNNEMVYLLGQEVFATFADAKDKAGTETIVVPPDIASGALLLARVILKKNATDTTDPTEAFILPSTAIASGGSSLTSLQQAYDISVQPQITTNSTGLAFEIRRGSAADTDNVFECSNGAGTTTFSVDGEGNVVSNNLVESDPSAVTGADQVDNVMSLTQAEYDAITPDAATFYVITDA